MTDNKAVVGNFLAALGCGDVEGVKRLITEDVAAVCTGTCVLSGTRLYPDICAATGQLRQVTRNGIEFRILSMTAEDDRVAVETEGKSTLLNGKPYNNQYHFLFFVRDGRICRIREYLDTKLVDDVLGPLMTNAAR